jgi:hypothetical protein
MAPLMILRLLLVLCLCGVTLAGELEDRLRDGFRLLDSRYYSPVLRIWLDRPGDDLRGHFEGRINPPWWSAANAVEGMVDAMNVLGTDEYDAMLARLHEMHREPAKRWPFVVEELKRRGQWAAEDERQLRRRMAPRPDHSEFRNEYLDDSGWWGIAWLKLAERTGHPAYLKTAKAIHAHMAATWQAEKGGVLWCLDADKRKTNTITNNLFLILSARLARHTGEASYREWAQRSYAWLKENKLFDGTGVVDGPGHTGDYWSYNQGTYLAALTALSASSKNPALLDEAATVARAVMNQAGFVTEKKLLKEKLGTSGWDGCLFKGIMARGLRELADALRAAKKHPELLEEIEQCLQATAAAIMAGTPRDKEFPAEWHEGAANKETNYNTHLSALLVLTAALPEPDGRRRHSTPR